MPVQIFSAVLHFLDFRTYIQLGFEKNLRQITAEFVNHNDLRENQIDDPNARLQAFHTQSFFLSQFHRTFSSQAKNGPPKSCLLLWTKIVRILCQENACWLILLLWMQLVRPFGPKKDHYFRVGSELTVFCVISLTFITKGTKNIGQKQCSITW